MTMNATIHAIRSLARPCRAAAAAALAIGFALLAAGCGALPDKPARAALYDFGPGPAATAQAPASAPAQMRPTLSERRMVLGPEESATISRSKGEVPDTLRISLDEFTHYFDSASASTGLVRLRATLIRGTPGGDRVLGQRVFTVRSPAPSADAPGGVKALIAASDAAVAEVVQWVDQLQQQPPRQ